MQLKSFTHAMFATEQNGVGAEIVQLAVKIRESKNFPSTRAN